MTGVLRCPCRLFRPTDWQALDASDLDIGGSGPVLFDVPGASPSRLVVALGKNGNAYLLDLDDLGGISNGVTHQLVASNEIINAAVAYTTPTATYVAFKGAGVGCPGGASGDLAAIRISAMAPPTIATAWCAVQNGTGSPMVTMLDGHTGAIVWGVGAEGDERLHRFDGDTGAVIFNGGGTGDTMAAGVSRYSTPRASRRHVDDVD
jgi:hypothetical protein